jgi:hypothetical protein
MPRHRPNVLLLLLATLAAIGLVLQLQHRQSENPTPILARELSTSRPSSPIPSSSAAPNSFQTIGSTTLADYATPNTTPEHDLASLGQLMNNFTLLVKSAADRPLSSNQEWSQALRGLNPSRQAFLPENHPIFDSQHQLIDRWGTPLFFHAEAKGEYSIRSAGPDRQLWTADDFQRNPDTTITRGTDLYPVHTLSR